MEKETRGGKADAVGRPADTDRGFSAASDVGVQAPQGGGHPVERAPAEVDCGVRPAGDAESESPAPFDTAHTARLASPYVTFEEPMAAAGDSTARSASASRRRRRIAAFAAAVAGLALLVCSLGFMAPEPDGGWSLAWLFQTTASEDDSSHDGSAAGSAEPSAAGSAAASHADAGQQEGGQQAAGTPEVSASEGAAGDATPGASASSGSSSQAPAGASGASGPAADSSDGAGQASGGAATGDPSANQPAQPQRQTVTVSVAVSSDAVGGSVAASGTYTFDQGATVYDALQALGLGVNAQSTQYGIYVSAIGGLAEKEHGATSGWMYTVNGRVAAVACSAYKLQDGDAVSWYYVTG